MERTRNVLIRSLVLLALIVVLLGPAQVVRAATIQSNGTGGGNWGNTSTWNGGVVPGVGDSVEILAGDDVGLDQSRSINSLKLSGNLYLTFLYDLEITGSSGPVLVLTHDWNLDGRTLTLSGNGGNIEVQGGECKFLNGHVFIKNDKTVTSSSGGSLTIETIVDLVVSGPSWMGTQLDLGSGLTTINGTLTISDGGQISLNGPAAYGSSSVLNYNTGSTNTYDVGPEWPSGSGSNVPVNVHLTTTSTTIQLPDPSGRTVRGTLTLDSNTNIKLASGSTDRPLTVNGNWINNGGNLYAGVSTVIMNSSVIPQTIGGSAGTNFYRLDINNTYSTTPVVTLAHDIGVTSELILSNGRLDLDVYTLTLNGLLTDSSPGTGRMIIADDTGMLCKVTDFTYFPIPFPAFIYYIGDHTDGLDYSPVTITFPSATFQNYTVCINVRDAKHPNIGSNVTNYLHRYWRITRSGSTSAGTFTGRFGYNASDVMPSPTLDNEDNLYGARYIPPTNEDWDWSNPVVPASHYFEFPAGTSMEPDAYYTALPKGPTAVTMAQMKAIASTGQVRIEWTTAQELDSSGFNVYRSLKSDGSDKGSISPFIDSQAPGGTSGASYQFADDTAQAGVTYYYWVEALGSDGGSTFFGPEQAAWFYNFYLPLLSK